MMDKVADELVTIAREAYTAMVLRDERRVAELVAPDAEWHNTAVFPGERVWRGPDGILAFWRTLSEDFEGSGGEIERGIESGDRAVLGFHAWGRGKASGAGVDVHWAAVFEIRDALVVRVDVYGSWDRAVESLSASA